jgi:hypothetical protein
MSAKPLNVEALLSAAFLRAELSFLRNQPPFESALKEIKTIEDFERLVTLAEDLLAEAGRTNPSAQQFRDSTNGPPSGQNTRER